MELVAGRVLGDGGSTVGVSAIVARRRWWVVRAPWGEVELHPVGSLSQVASWSGHVGPLTTRIRNRD
jgi:hypothetical protein